MTPQPNGHAHRGGHHHLHHDPLSAVVIGMGPAGMGAALSLTALGFRVHVVERDNLTDQGAGAASTPSQVCSPVSFTSLQWLLVQILPVILRVRTMLLSYP